MSLGLWPCNPLVISHTIPLWSWHLMEHWSSLVNAKLRCYLKAILCEEWVLSSRKQYMHCIPNREKTQAWEPQNRSRNNHTYHHFWWPPGGRVLLSPHFVLWGLFLTGSTLLSFGTTGIPLNYKVNLLPGAHWAACVRGPAGKRRRHHLDRSNWPWSILILNFIF